MGYIRFKTDWLTQIALAAKCGTPDDVAALCVAIQRASAGIDIEELPTLVEVLFNPIAEDIAEMQALSEARASARRNAAKTNKNKTTTKNNKTSTKNNKSAKEEGEEEKEEKEESPHTPQEEREVKEEGEEENNIYTASGDAGLPALPPPVDVVTPLTDKALEEEFETLWANYPRKIGKKDALRHYKVARKHGTTFDEVLNGLFKYAEYVEGEDLEFIKHGSAWFCGHHWEDDITPRARSGTTNTRKMSAEDIYNLPAIDPWTGGGS